MNKYFERGVKSHIPYTQTFWRSHRHSWKCHLALFALTVYYFAALLGSAPSLLMAIQISRVIERSSIWMPSARDVTRNRVRVYSKISRHRQTTKVPKHALAKRASESPLVVFVVFLPRWMTQSFRDLVHKAKRDVGATPMGNEHLRISRHCYTDFR